MIVKIKMNGNTYEGDVKITPQDGFTADIELINGDYYNIKPYRIVGQECKYFKISVVDGNGQTVESKPILFVENSADLSPVSNDSIKIRVKRSKINGSPMHSFKLRNHTKNFKFTKRYLKEGINENGTRQKMRQPDMLLIRLESIGTNSPQVIVVPQFLGHYFDHVQNYRFPSLSATCLSDFENGTDKYCREDIIKIRKSKATFKINIEDGDYKCFIYSSKKPFNPNIYQMIKVNSSTPLDTVN